MDWVKHWLCQNNRLECAAKNNLDVFHVIAVGSNTIRLFNWLIDLYDYHLSGQPWHHKNQNYQRVDDWSDLAAEFACGTVIRPLLTIRNAHPLEKPGRAETISHSRIPNVPIAVTGAMHDPCLIPTHTASSHKEAISFSVSWGIIIVTLWTSFWLGDEAMPVREDNINIIHCENGRFGIANIVIKSAPKGSNWE